MLFCRENNLEKKLLEKKLIRSWQTVMGNTISQLTRGIEIKNGILFLYINNAALKQQLFEQRDKVVQKLNNFLGISLIKGIKIYG